MTLLHIAKHSGAAQLTAGTRYLQEQLHAHGLRVALSEGCLQDFVRDASEAVVRTQQQGESDFSCLCRHLDARARFILLWTSSDESFDRATWEHLVAIAHRHTLPRAWSPAPKPSKRPNTQRAAIAEAAEISDAEEIAEAAEIPQYRAAARKP